MTLEEHIAYWIESAERNLNSANSNFQSENYDWCLFIGHLVLEKALKALYAQNNNNETPPKIHNLLRLAELSNVDLTDEQSKLFSLINKFQMEARYPDYKNELYRLATKEFTQSNLEKIMENYLWLKSLIILKK